MDPSNPNSNLSALVNPQDYARTREVIRNTRLWMDQVEAQNEAGLQAFAYTEQELQRRIREGREAEMLAAQLRVGNLAQQTFIAQQPQVSNWQTSSMLLPNTYQQVFPTSARIEEVPSVSSGRTSRSGSHSTLQRNDSNSSNWNPQFHQPEVPESTGVSYEQSHNRSNVPVQQTTYISHDFYSREPSRRQNYYAPPVTVPIPTAPAQQPLPPIVHQSPPQPPPQQEPPHPVAAASSPTSLHPIPVHNASGLQPSIGQDQRTAQYNFVKSVYEALQKHPEDVQMKAINQIFEYINGKSNPNPQIRAWGDQLKQVGGSDPMQLLNCVRTRLVKQKKTRQAAVSQTRQLQPQPQAMSPPQPQPAPQPQFQTAQPEQPPQPQPTSAGANSTDRTPHQPPSQQQAYQNLMQKYSRELSEAKVDQKRIGDIMSIAYVSARLKQPPKDPDIWVQKTWQLFEKHFTMDRLPLVFANILTKLKRPIPDVPVSAEPPTVDHSSSSLAAASGDSPSNVTPSTVMQQSHVVAQPLEDNPDMRSEMSDVLPEARLPDPASTTDSWAQVAESTPDVSRRLPSSSSMTLTNLRPTTTNQYTTTIPNGTAHQDYQPMDLNQLALVPRRNFSTAIPNLTQGKLRQPQPSGWAPDHQSEASTSTLPGQPPVKIRLPREADRSRLAKDILKQLGKPSGSVPAVPTRHEYEERKKTGAYMEATSAQPLTEPVVAESQPSLNHDDPPLPSEIVHVPDQVPLSGPSAPPATSAVEPPLLEYPDPDTGSATHDADATEEDVNMDIQPREDPLVPQPQSSPRSDLPHESVPSPVVPESVVDRGERPVVNQPPLSELPLSKRSGPPPDAEIIEISDDEEQAAVYVVTNTVEPMEVDEEVRTGGAISQSLSELSLDGDDTLVAAETEKDRAKKPLGSRSSQEPIDLEDMQLTERKLQKNKPFVEVPPLPDYARQKKGKERAPVQEEDEEDPEVRAVVDLAFSRLRPTRCLWLGCKATLNSVDNLIKHLKIHVDEAERTSDNLECQWKKCARSYRTRAKLDRHCVHHAQKVLYCPYEDCGEEFRDAGELLDHTKDMHESSDLLPSTNPVPYPGRALDALPQQVPSWSVFPVSVAPVPISVDRHGQAGRWVARNICGTAKKPESSRRLRSSRRFDTAKQKSTASEAEMMNEERFGFLSSTDDGNTPFADIPSEAVSSYCRYGLLTLSDDNDHLGEGRDSSRRQPGPEGVDGEDGVIRTGVPEEDVISLELEPVSSEDELLLRPTSA